MTITKDGDEFITTDETGEKVGLRKFTAEGLEMVCIIRKWKSIKNYYFYMYI